MIKDSLQHLELSELIEQRRDVAFYDHPSQNSGLLRYFWLFIGEKNIKMPPNINH